jgi:hypothetical protein
MFESILTLENAALEKLTNERRASGSIPQEVNETLYALGVHWDEIEQEYFSIDAFQKETFERLVNQYVSKDYA